MFQASMQTGQCGGARHSTAGGVSLETGRQGAYPRKEEICSILEKDGRARALAGGPGRLSRPMKDQKHRSEEDGTVWQTEAAMSEHTPAFAEGSSSLLYSLIHAPKLCGPDKPS